MWVINLHRRCQVFHDSTVVSIPPKKTSRISTKLIQSIDRSGFGSKLTAMNFRNRSMKYESRPFRVCSDNFVFYRLQTSHRSANIRFPSPGNRRVIVECFDIVPHMDVLNAEHRKFLCCQKVSGYINRKREVSVLR